MARGQTRSAVAESIDFDLDRAIRRWASLPAMVEEWPEWDEISKLIYVEEWGIQRGRLRRLAEWSARGEMSDKQAQRYRELLALVEKYDPLREHLFET